MRNGRKGTMMVALGALLVAIFATAAYADTINCQGGNCFGTDDPDILNEVTNPPRPLAANEQMYGFRGADELNAWQYGWSDTDKLYGGRGNDTLNAADNDPDDLVYGGRGRNDVCIIDAGDETKGCDRNVQIVS